MREIAPISAILKGLRTWYLVPLEEDSALVIAFPMLQIFEASAKMGN